MQDKDAGIALETHEVQDNKVYRHCFSGTYNKELGSSHSEERNVLLSLYILKMVDARPGCIIMLVFK